MHALGITGTGTDIGKTYISGLILKSLNEAGLSAAYYKPCASGTLELKLTDGGRVREMAGLKQSEKSLCSYLYAEPLSPHLAARHTGVYPSLEKITADYKRLTKSYEYVLMEGAGGIICPVVHEKERRLSYEDIFRKFSLPLCVVASASLGTINHTTLTCAYLKERGFNVQGIILNEFDEQNEQHLDNLSLIEDYTGIKVIAYAKVGALTLKLREKELWEYFL